MQLLQGLHAGQLPQHRLWSTPCDVQLLQALQHTAVVDAQGSQAHRQDIAAAQAV
jgi:hypothetical protein